MAVEIDKSFLLFGEDIPVSGGIFVNNPSVKEIRELSKSPAISGFKIYENYMSWLCLEPIDVADILYVDTNIWYKDITAYQLFIAGCSSDSEYLKALSWFTNKDFIYVSGSEIEEPYLYYLKENEDMMILDRKVFDEIALAIKSINYVGERDRPNFESEKSEKTYLTKIRKKRRFKEVPTIDLLSIISSISWKVGIQPSEILDYKISQIYDGYFRINNMDNYDKTLYGIYSGNIDGSTIDMEKLNWSKILSI